MQSQSISDSNTFHVLDVLKSDDGTKKRKNKYKKEWMNTHKPFEMKRFIIIMPGDPFHHTWKILTLIITLMSSIMYGFFAAMRKDVEYQSYDEYAANLLTNLAPCFDISEETIQNLNVAQVIFESFYLVDICLGFITSYKNESNIDVEDLNLTWVHYLNNGFRLNLLLIIPFNSFIKRPNSRLLYLLKWIRLIRINAILDTRKFYNELVHFLYAKKFKAALQDADLAEDQDKDHNKIVQKILVKYSIKISKLLLVNLMLIFMLSVLFFIWQDYTSQFNPVSAMFPTQFQKLHDLDKRQSAEVLLIMLYWAFTTLSTIGLGDYYPVSNYERSVMCVGFVLGVAMFSVIMKMFIRILNKMLKLNEKPGEGNKL